MSPFLKEKKGNFSFENKKLKKKGNDGIEPSTFWLTANCSTPELITLKIFIRITTQLQSPLNFEVKFKILQWKVEHIGARTQNPRLKRPSLYHWAICSFFCKNQKAGKEGIEPPDWSLKLHILPLNYFPLLVPGSKVKL